MLRSSTAGWVVYRRTHDIQPTGVVAMRQDSSYYNNWIPRKWGEKGVKKNVNVKNKVVILTDLKQGVLTRIKYQEL